MRKNYVLALAAALAVLPLEKGAAATRDVMAVLSSESSYYRQAYDGFQQLLGDRAGVMTLQNDKLTLPPEVKVVVAFGAKAALQTYPKNVSLVYCMAPGTLVPANRQTRHPIKVEMQPRPGFVLSKIKEIQPELKRLAVFWSTDAMDEYVREMQKAAPSFGVTIEAAHLATPDDLPESLRSLKTQPDAFWLPPDPTLITPTSFSVLKEYAWSNHVPFYVPTDGLVEKGATASIASSLREIGRTAAAAVQQLDAKDKKEMSIIYPEEIGITISRANAQKTGLDLKESALPKGATVLP